MFIETRAWPFCSWTRVMSPTGTPAIVTTRPWPGVTGRPMSWERRAGPERRRHGAGEQVYVGLAQDCARRDRLVAAAGLEADVHSVAVEVLALARQPHQRVPELLVVLDVGAQGPVLDPDVAGGQDDVGGALGREVGLEQQLQAGVDDPGQVADRGVQRARHAL